MHIYIHISLFTGHSVAMKIGSTLVVHAGITLDHLSPQLCNGYNGQDKDVDGSGVQCLEHLNTYVLLNFVT
jgi:hypothetical protein